MERQMFRLLLLFLAVRCIASERILDSVDLVSGRLNFRQTDLVVEAVEPLIISHTFKGKTKDKLIFPHIELSFNAEVLGGGYVCEPDGTEIHYSKSPDGNYRPIRNSQAFDKEPISARNNPFNNILIVQNPRKEIRISLPTGGYRIYKISRDVKRGYFLGYEVLPNGHVIDYQYDDNQRLKRLETKNGNFIYAWAQFHYPSKNQLTIQTSNQQIAEYEFEEHHEHFYLKKVSSPGGNCATANFTYEKGKDGTRFLKYYHLNGQIVLEAIQTNGRIHQLKSLNEDGQWFIARNFEYSNYVTDSRDAENILTRFHFNSSNKVEKIEYLNKNDQLHSAQVFRLTETRDSQTIKESSLYDAKQMLIYSKSIYIDGSGNVQKEVFTDGPTGTSSIKQFRYQNNLPVYTEEDTGLVTLYTYKEGTDLVESKLEKGAHGIFRRQFFTYSDQSVLSEKIVDDGTTPDKANMTGVTERQILRVISFDTNRYPKEIQNLYWDRETKKEVLIQKKVVTYNSRNKISQEEIYDLSGKLAYTHTFEYDAKGNKKNKRLKADGYVKQDVFEYDPFGRLISESTANSPITKEYIYSTSGNLRFINEKNRDGKVLKKTTEYDLKGNPKKITDEWGNITTSDYDPFGNPITIRYPELLDEEGVPYFPIIQKEYDIQGNAKKTTDPRKVSTSTTYTATREPLKTIYENGSSSTNTYNSNRTLATTKNALGTTTKYEYDLQQRMIAKRIYSSENTLLSEALWSYSTFQLKSHTNEEGRTTEYFYDGAGRKIKEESDGHTIQFSYDSLGHLTCIKDLETKVAHHIVSNCLGEKIEEWVEQPSGKIEDHTLFKYNSYGKIIKFTRGKSIDTLDYDSWGRKTYHRDPDGNETHISYNDAFINVLGQKVLQKTTTLLNGMQVIETYDAMGKIVCIEKRHSQAPIHKEEIFYDRAGNKARVVDHIFYNQNEIRTIATRWEFNGMNLLKKEIEPGGKTTEYDYDEIGRKNRVLKSDGTTIRYLYDDLDRLTEVESIPSPQSQLKNVHYRFQYDENPLQKTGPKKIYRNPLLVEDLIDQSTHYCTYKNGKIASETNGDHVTMKWDYDRAGRVEQLTLPDLSSIQHSYSGNHLHEVSRPSYSHTYVDFDDHGLLIKEKLPFQLGFSYSEYDLLDRPKSKTDPWETTSQEFFPNGEVSKTDSKLFGATGYTYDPLSQLATEGNETFSFDSFGNPVETPVNDESQLVREDLDYDSNGNLIKRGQYTFAYDALDRLIELKGPEGDFSYTYDPFNRLKSQKSSNGILYFLYDGNTEIGALDENRNLIQLRVLGEKSNGELGATIAIELAQDIYIPLHDLKGNIVGLAPPSNELIETYKMNTFGSSSIQNPLSPWRYSSKRHFQADLINFGYRFYDPTLSRWLTPDPAGSIDSRNRYLFVLNSPPNRLDRWGLVSDFNFYKYESGFSPLYPSVRFDVMPMLGMGTIPELITQLGMVFPNLIIHGDQIHRLCTNPTESYETKMLELVSHFSKIDSTIESGIIGTALCNGVNVSAEEFTHYVTLRSQSFNDEVFTIGRYNPSSGFRYDMNRLKHEKGGLETPAVVELRTLLACTSKACDLLGPQFYFTFELHSEATSQYYNAFDKLSDPQKDLVRNHILVIALGGTTPIPKSFGLDVVNLYSVADIAYKFFGKKFVGNPSYNIKVLPSLMPYDERPPIAGDHGYLGETYKVGGMHEQRNFDRDYYYLRLRKR